MIFSPSVNRVQEQKHILLISSYTLTFHWTASPHTDMPIINGTENDTMSKIQFSSVAQSCPSICDPMNRSTPGLPVHHQLPEFTETHVHWVGDAIQLSHPLSSPFPPAPNPSQHQSLFQWINSSHEVVKVLGVSALASFLPKNTQDWSPLEWTGWVSLQSKGLSRVFSSTTVHNLSGLDLGGACSPGLALDGSQWST